MLAASSVSAELQGCDLASGATIQVALVEWMLMARSMRHLAGVVATPSAPRAVWLAPRTDRYGRAVHFVHGRVQVAQVAQAAQAPQTL